MGELKVRRIPFEFDGVEFIWNPTNPAFSVMTNLISFLAIGLEKYFCQVMADADSLIRDPEVLKEARLFKIQEAIHAQAHRRHVEALIARYPGLQETLDKTIACYDALYEEKDLKYHLAYAGGLEATFTPTFKQFLDNREILFAGGEARVASLFLWHFSEEIEHRNSAISVFNDVVGSSLYRLRHVRGCYLHSTGCGKMIREGFKQHVPDVPPEAYTTSPLKDVPKRDQRRVALGILASQLPWYNHDRQPLPRYYDEWCARYDNGEDMTLTYGVRA
jgi:hypothetical protein